MARSNTSTIDACEELNTIREHLLVLERLLPKGKPEEDFMKALLYELPGAFYIVKDGLFKYVSPQFKQITGIFEAELLGKSPLSLVAAEDSKIFNEKMVSLLKSKRSHVHEYRIVTQNAKLKWVMEIASPILSNGIGDIIANLIDVTELREAEKSKQRIEELSSDLCEHVSDMVHCTTPHGLITYINRSWREIMGYRQDEIINRPLYEIVPSDYRDYWLGVLNQAISSEQACDIDSALIHSNDNVVHVQGTASCKFVDKRPVYVRWILRDITKLEDKLKKQETELSEINEIRKRLEESKREFEEFIHVASHDIREPLRKISSFGALLQESVSSELNDDQLENLSFMTDGALRMQSMIDDLLTYSRITTRAMPFQPVDLNEVVVNLRNFEIAALLEETGGEILIPSPLQNVFGDLSQIHQILQNLIANGLKFHKGGIPPRVTITSYLAAKNMVRVNVQDDGIGIDPKYHDQIFIMFKRLQDPNRYQGTGIGLSICKKIVQRHGGQIGVYSMPENGTTLWFTLPRFNST